MDHTKSKNKIVGCQFVATSLLSIQTNKKIFPLTQKKSNRKITLKN